MPQKQNLFLDAAKNYSVIMAESDSVIAKEWRKIEEDVEKTYIRPMNVENLKCVLKCFDKAGTAWSARELEECKAPCYQKSQIKQMFIDRVSDSNALL
jgi:hypothetical protein